MKKLLIMLTPAAILFSAAPFATAQESQTSPSPTVDMASVFSGNSQMARVDNADLPVPSAPAAVPP